MRLYKIYPNVLLMAFAQKVFLSYLSQQTGNLERLQTDDVPSLLVLFYVI